MLLAHNNATMPPDRITTAINGLISHVVPSDPDEDDDDAQERHELCYDLVRSIMDEYEPPRSYLFLEASWLTEFLSQSQHTCHRRRRKPLLQPDQEEAHPDRPEPGPPLQQPIFQAALPARPEPEMGNTIPPPPAHRFPRSQRARTSGSPTTAWSATGPAPRRRGTIFQGIDASTGARGGGLQRRLCAGRAEEVSS